VLGVIGITVFFVVKRNRALKKESDAVQARLKQGL
jgi:hypothetical protein